MTYRPSNTIDPFTVTTTIVTTVDPKTFNETQLMQHSVSVDTDAPEEMPDYLTYAVAQAACEHTMEHLAQFGIGVMGEIVEEEPEPPSRARCAEGNMLRYHPDGPCNATCDVAEIVEVEVVA